MTNNLVIRDSSKEDFIFLLENLQLKDKEEVLKYNLTQEQILDSFDQAIYRRTALVNNIVISCWGVLGDYIGYCGSPYFLTTPYIRQIPTKTILRIYKQEVSLMNFMFPVLVVQTDAMYTEALKLLEMTGFKKESQSMINDNIFFNLSRSCDVTSVKREV